MVGKKSNPTVRESVVKGKEFIYLFINLCATVFIYVYKCTCCDIIVSLEQVGERGGLVVNASDSGSRGRGFEPHLGQTVLCP